MKKPKAQPFVYERGKKLAKIIERLRLRRVCAYHHERCDCKYGAHNLDKGWGSEDGNGCPEMRVVVALLERLSDVEIERALKRKPDVGFFVCA